MGRGGGGAVSTGKAREVMGGGLNPVCRRGPRAGISSLHSFLEVIASMTTNPMASNDTTCAPMVLDTGNLKSLCQ